MMENRKKGFARKAIKIVIWTILGVIAAAGFAILFGLVVMWLWNALMPVIFSLPIIKFWQAVGLIILGKLLFGGFGHGGGDKEHGRSKKRRGRMGPSKGFSGFGSEDWRDCDKSDWESFKTFWDIEGKERYNNYKENIETVEEKKDNE